MMVLSSVIFAAMSAVLWLPIVAIGLLRLRAMPRPSMMLIGAGIVGFVERIATPTLTAVATAALLAQPGGVDNMLAVQLGTWVIGSLLSFVPWVLLLVGLWHFVVAHPRIDPEAPLRD